MPMSPLRGHIGSEDVYTDAYTPFEKERHLSIKECWTSSYKKRGHMPSLLFEFHELVECLGIQFEATC